MENKELNIIGFLFIVILIFSCYMNFLLEKSNSNSITENNNTENIIPAYKKKKCGHLFNNRYCGSCRYYRYHKDDLQYYKD